MARWQVIAAQKDTGFVVRKTLWYQPRCSTPTRQEATLATTICNKSCS